MNEIVIDDHPIAIVLPDFTVIEDISSPHSGVIQNSPVSVVEPSHPNHKNIFQFEDSDAERYAGESCLALQSEKLQPFVDLTSNDTQEDLPINERVPKKFYSNKRIPGSAHLNILSSSQSFPISSKEKRALKQYEERIEK